MIIKVVVKSPVMMNSFLAFDASVRGGGPYQNIVIPFGTEKPEWCGYSMVKKSDDMFSRFDRKLACGQQTDRRTEASCHSIVRAMHRRRAVIMSKR